MRVRSTLLLLLAVLLVVLTACTSSPTSTATKQPTLSPTQAVATQMPTPAPTTTPPSTIVNTGGLPSYAVPFKDCKGTTQDLTLYGNGAAQGNSTAFVSNKWCAIIIRLTKGTGKTLTLDVEAILFEGIAVAFTQESTGDVRLVFYGPNELYGSSSLNVEGLTPGPDWTSSSVVLLSPAGGEATPQLSAQLVKDILTGRIEAGSVWSFGDTFVSGARPCNSLGDVLK